jgi:hypothetical protein
MGAVADGSLSTDGSTVLSSDGTQTFYGNDGTISILPPPQFISYIDDPAPGITLTPEEKEAIAQSVARQMAIDAYNNRPYVNPAWAAVVDSFVIDQSDSLNLGHDIGVVVAYVSTAGIVIQVGIAALAEDGAYMLAEGAFAEGATVEVVTAESVAEELGASIYDTSITQGGAVTNVATNVTASEAQTTLLSNGYSVASSGVSSNGTYTVLSNGVRSYTIYTGSSTGGPSAALQIAGRTILKIRFGGL